jgi:hypothetical protein
MTPSKSFGSRVAKFYIFLIGALCAVACVWTILNMVDYSSEKQRIASDTELLDRIRLIAPELGVYIESGWTAQKRKEEQARGNWFTFFGNIASTCNLGSDQYVLPSQREVRGRNYVEKRFDIQVRGVDSRSTALFLWEAEKRRSYLKATEVKLHKPRKVAEDEDKWDGKIVVAYREKH